uniref:Focal AT domain-containing protein n=1 Tax=Neogobius melanostomus TaxID=47308 RepID=A0A8C6UIP0_9GOBI
RVVGSNPSSCRCTLWLCPLATHFPLLTSSKLLNTDLAELISKMRLAQQNSVTSLRDDCVRNMLAAAHTLALDSKNLLDAVDQARVPSGPGPGTEKRRLL